MKANLKATYTKVDGSKLMETDREGRELSKEVTLRDVLSIALMNAKQDEKDMTIKYNRYLLLQKVNDKKTVTLELTSEEVTDLKQLVGETYSVLIFGQTVDRLEDKGSASKKDKDGE